MSMEQALTMEQALEALEMVKTIMQCRAIPVESFEISEHESREGQMTVTAKIKLWENEIVIEESYTKGDKAAAVAAYTGLIKDILGGRYFNLLVNLLAKCGSIAGVIEEVSFLCCVRPRTKSQWDIYWFFEDLILLNCWEPFYQEIKAGVKRRLEYSRKKLRVLRYIRGRWLVGGSRQEARTRASP